MKVSARLSAEQTCHHEPLTHAGANILILPTLILPTTASLFTGSYQPGVYRLVSHTRPASILKTVTGWGWRAGTINGKMVDDKSTFLDAVAQALAFPSYYGRNWDAFEEMINDLSWISAPGYLILYDYVHRFAAHQPDAWQTALNILQSACNNWQQEGIPFYLLLRHNWHWNRQLPKLTAQF